MLNASLSFMETHSDKLMVLANINKTFPVSFSYTQIPTCTLLRPCNITQDQGHTF